MQFTVIGFWGAYPEPGNATSSYLIEHDGYTCLLDCGSGTLSRLQYYKNIMDIDAVILSHYHNDHIADIGVLQYSWLVQNSINGTEDVLPIYGHADNKEAFAELTHRFTKGIAYDPNTELQLGPFTFSFMKTAHPVSCYAMRITDGRRTIVYTADTAYKDELISFCQDTDLLITDCSFYQGQDGSKPGHMTSVEGAVLAKKSNAKELVLSHHPHFGNTSELEKQARSYFDGKTKLAYEGLTWKYDT